MLIVLDVDYTLLDTTAFKQAMQDAVKPFEISEELFEKTYQRVVSMVPNEYNYDVEQHARFLAQQSSASVFDVVTALQGVIDRTQSFLFPDVADTIEQWNSEGHIQVIFTRGNPDWQEQKIVKTGLLRFFDDIFCIADEKHNIRLKYNIPESDWVFINDSPKEIVAFERQHPKARLIRIARKKGKHFSDEEEAAYADNMRSIPTVSSFSEITL